MEWMGLSAVIGALLHRKCRSDTGNTKIINPFAFIFVKYYLKIILLTV